MKKLFILFLFIPLFFKGQVIPQIGNPEKSFFAPSIGVNSTQLRFKETAVFYAGAYSWTTSGQVVVYGQFDETNSGSLKFIHSDDGNGNISNNLIPDITGVRDFNVTSIKIDDYTDIGNPVLYMAVLVNYYHPNGYYTYRAGLLVAKWDNFSHSFVVNPNITYFSSLTALSVKNPKINHTQTGEMIFSWIEGSVFDNNVNLLINKIKCTNSGNFFNVVSGIINLNTYIYSPNWNLSTDYDVCLTTNWYNDVKVGISSIVYNNINNESKVVVFLFDFNNITSNIFYDLANNINYDSQKFYSDVSISTVVQEGNDFIVALKETDLNNNKTNIWTKSCIRGVLQNAILQNSAFNENFININSKPIIVGAFNTLLLVWQHEIQNYSLGYNPGGAYPWDYNSLILAKHIAIDGLPILPYISLFGYIHQHDLTPDYFVVNNSLNQNFFGSNFKAAASSLNAGDKFVFSFYNILASPVTIGENINVTYKELTNNFYRTNNNPIKPTFSQNIINEEILENICNEQPLKIYPNPAVNFINVIIPKLDCSKNIKMFDINGKIVKTINNIKTENVKIDVSTLSKGVYSLEVTSKCYNKNLLFIKL